MFENIIGHDNEKLFFERRLADKSISHAYCFDGKDGIGKRSFAVQIARNMLCGDSEKLQKFFDSGSHGDFLSISPEDGSIKTEKVIEILDFLSTAPSLSDYKFILIDEAEKMNLVAQNKILKIIEEPPNFAVFVLITSKYTALIDTLKSRLIRVPFNPLRNRDVESYCNIRNIEYNKKFFEESSGSISKYLSIADSNDESLDKIAVLVIDSIKSNDGIKIFNALELVLEKKDKFYLLLNSFENLYFGLNATNKPEYTKVLGLISELRYRLNRNQQLDLLIILFFNGLQEVFNDKCSRG